MAVRDKMPEENDFCRRVFDRGFVRMVEYAGDDYAPARAARISYGRESKGADQDERLMNYLITHDHSTPFEMVWMKWHIKCPIFVARQWMRHRSMSYNEISGRYTTFEEEFYVPRRGRISDPDNKQGSKEHFDYHVFRTTKDDKFSEKYPTADLWHDDVAQTIERASHTAFLEYQDLRDMGVANELARMVLPTNYYTQFYAAANLRSWMHFLNLRLDEHAQLEIREYARAIFLILENTHPVLADLMKKTVFRD